MKTLFLVIGSSGEYSERMEWPVALYETEGMARIAAEGAKRTSCRHRAIFKEWRERVLEPWYAANPAPRYGYPSIDEWRRNAAVRNKAIPQSPELRNLFDPEHGDGDEYTVEPVPLLTELPADNPDQHQQPEQPRAQDEEQQDEAADGGDGRHHPPRRSRSNSTT